MGKDQRQSRKRNALAHPKLHPEPTSIAEANTQQDFVNILDKDVIEPLTALKASLKSLMVVVPILILEPSEGNDKSDKNAG